MPTLSEIAGQKVKIFDTSSNQSKSDDIVTLFNELVAFKFDDPNAQPVLVHDNGKVQRVVSNGVFSDRELKVAIEIGHIICDPLARQINNSSIDVTLGYYFYHAGKLEDGNELFNPFDRNDTNRYFGINDPDVDFMEAKPWGEVLGKLRRQMGKKALKNFDPLQALQGIPIDHPMVLLRPGERILGHTQEFVGILQPGTSSMQARSTTGRIGLSACYCAGWGDSGFVNRWAMEIQNLNENEYLPLPVGYRIAQMIFSTTGPVATEYAKASGNYQSLSGSNIERIKATWHPYSLIPRAYTNKIQLPVPVLGLQAGLK